MIVDNNNTNSNYTFLSSPTISGSYTFDGIQVRRYGNLATGNSTSFSTITIVGGSLSGDLTGSTTIYGNLNLTGGSFNLISSSLTILSGAITGSANTIALGTYTYLAVSTAPTYIVGSMTLQPGAVLRHLPNMTSSKVSWLDLLVTTFTVSGGAFVRLDGLGYTKTNGTGAGTLSSGGGHGGTGGLGNAGVGGPANDSITNPIDLGSGAGTTNSGGTGGGAIRITSTGNSHLINGKPGTVRRGNTGVTADAAGGGAGGSINISANIFTGTGTLTAVGGNGTANGGGGSGGRIAISTSGSGGYISWGGNSLCSTSTVAGGTGLNPASSGSIVLNGIVGTCDATPPAAVTNLFASTWADGRDDRAPMDGSWQ